MAKLIVAIRNFMNVTNKRRNNIHALSRIWTRSPSNRATADLRLKRPLHTQLNCVTSYLTEKLSKLHSFDRQ